MARIAEDNLVDVYQIAQDFGCSDRQVQIYANRGMPKAGHGRYDRMQCALWYIAELKRQVDEAGEVGALEAQQTRVQRATADLKELELAEKRGQSIPIDLYKKHVGQHFLTVRQNLLAISAQMAPQLEGLDRLEIKTRLHQRMRDILSQLAAGADVTQERVISDDSDTDTPPHSDASKGGPAQSDAPGNEGRPGGAYPAIGPGAASSKPGNRGTGKGPVSGRPRTKGDAKPATGRKPKRVGGKKHNPAKGHK